MSGFRLAVALGALGAVGFGLAVLTGHPPPRPLKGPDQAKLESARPLARIAVGSCADQNRPEPIWRAVRAADPDLFVFMGDNVYGDAKNGAADMPELKAAYQQLGALSGFRRLRRHTPILAIWDDHDYGRNDGDRTFALKAQSKALFLKFWGISSNSPRARRPGLYTARIIGPPGQRVQIILLDLRWFRDPWRRGGQKGPGHNGAAPYAPDPDPHRTMLGAAQWAWLEGELHKEAELRLIVSSIQVEADSHGFERWGIFPHERQRLYDLIARSRAGGVIFLSGDRHAGALYKLSHGVPYPLFEMTSSSLNKPAAVKDGPDPNRLGPIYPRENFGLISIDWALRTVRLALKDIEGREVMAASVALATLTPPAAGTSLVHDELPAGAP